MAPIVNWARCKIEIYERPLGLLDDHFRSGWVLIRSAASQSFANNGGLVGDLATMTVTESGTSDGCGYEKGSLSISTDTYRRFRARLKSGGGYQPKFSIYVKFSDASDVYIGWTGAPPEMTAYSLSLPAGKTVIAIQLFARAGGGANNQTASVTFDYVAIIKGDPITPDGDTESLDVELCATTAISGFKFALLNDKGLYTVRPSVGDFVMVYLAAPEENLDQKLISGPVTARESSGEPDNPMVTIRGEDLGSVLNDRTFTKKYVSSALISQVVKDMKDQEMPELTKFSVEATDNSITPEFNEEGAFNLLRKLANAARKNGVYGYDFYVDPAGDLHFVPNPKYTCTEKIYAGIFYDDFCGNLDKWDILNGSWAIEDEELSQGDTTSGEYKKIEIRSLKFGDYAIEFQVKLIEYVTDKYFKCFYRLQDDTHYYYAGYIASEWRLGENLGSGEAGLFDSAAGTWEPNVWYNIKIEADGQTHKLYVNGQLKITRNQTGGYTTGKAQLGTYTTHAHFDNATVKAVNEPAYNVKEITCREILEDVANHITLLTREGEYNPRDKDAWTENISRWESPQTQVSLTPDNTDKKQGNNSIKAEWTSDPGLTVRLRRNMTADISQLKKVKLWITWSVTGPLDYWRIRLYSGSYSEFYQKETYVGSSAPASKPWGTIESHNLADFTKTGNPSNEITIIEIALRNTTTNIGTGHLKVDGLHFAIDPVTFQTSDSDSQGKYGVKKRNFEDLTLSDQNLAQYTANALCQLLKNPIKHVHAVILGKAQEGYRPPAQVVVSSAKDSIYYEYFKILKARHHYVIQREEAPLYLCDLDLITAKKTDGTYEVPIAQESPSLQAFKPGVELAQRLDVVARKGYYWY